MDSAEGTDTSNGREECPDLYLLECVAQPFLVSDFDITEKTQREMHLLRP
jgi:hypothetical protein